MPSQPETLRVSATNCIQLLRSRRDYVYRRRRIAGGLPGFGLTKHCLDSTRAPSQAGLSRPTWHDNAVNLNRTVGLDKGDTNPGGRPQRGQERAAKLPLANYLQGGREERGGGWGRERVVWAISATVSLWLFGGGELFVFPVASIPSRVLPTRCGLWIFRWAASPVTESCQLCDSLA